MATNKTTNGTPKKSNINWKEVTIGGVSGILLGGAGTFAATAAPIDVTEEETEQEVQNEENVEANEETTTTSSTVSAHGNVASGVNDNMSFNEAFAAARAEVGAGGCFVWHGNVYGTYYANEWNAMTPEQHDEFTAQTLGVDTSHSHATNTYAHHSTGSNHTETTTTGHEGENQSGEDDMTVEVLGVEQVQNEDGSVSNIGVAGINGQAAYFIDVDGQDGEFDLMAADLNANGNLEENEITDISDQHMQVSQFQELAQASGNGGSGSGNEVQDYYASNENLPDYVNDADPVDLA